MGEVFANYDVWGAIWMTVKLAVLSGIGATFLGTIVAILRVSPVPILRGIGTSYVTLLRNTPLTVLLSMSVLGVSFILGLSLSDDLATNAFWWAVIMLSLYHGAFICEALRSGINTVPTGQAEAARAIGLTFSQSLTQVMLPQAFRGAVAPLASTYIALIKNTTVAAVIGVADVAGLLATITENEGSRLGIFFFFAMIFVVLTLPIGIWGTSLSRRLAVKR